jgi:diguanylate cyclase (GGDEF)-like protein
MPMRVGDPGTPRRRSSDVDPVTDPSARRREAPPVQPAKRAVPGEAPAAPSSMLAAWVAIQTTAAVALLVAAFAIGPLRPDIALSVRDLDPAVDVPLGLVFWILFGLVGGLKTRERPGGSVMTFSMPFIVAGTVLGGPVAGGLLGVFSELELREIRNQPWYGLLSNHAVAVIAAVGGGAAGDAVGPALAAVGVTGPAEFFLRTATTALGFAAINVLLVVPTLALRFDATLDEAARAFDPHFRLTTVIETVVAWLMAVTWLSVGWWGPVICALLVLLLWDFVENAEGLRRDPRTGLLNPRGYLPLLTDALAAAHAGRRNAALVYLDLDGFKRINDVYLRAAGDEVIRTVATRLLRAVRATDAVGRSNAAGDEFVVLLNGVPDRSIATALARRIQAKVGEPIALGSAEPVSVGASIGVVFLARQQELDPASGRLEAFGSIDEVLELAEARMQEAKVVGGTVVDAGSGDVKVRLRRGDRRSEARAHEAEPLASAGRTRS